LSPTRADTAIDEGSSLKDQQLRQDKTTGQFCRPSFAEASLSDGFARLRRKQISVPSETGEGKVFEEWVGEVSVLALGFAARPPESFGTQKTWLEHCMLTGSAVCFQSAGKSKRNSGL
jgi:hypothetical protein